MTKESLNFIEEIIEEDIANGKHEGRIHTRFPPEPNGFLHIGHCKAICLNFEIAKKYGGKTNLRFDDTNPVTEDTKYVEAIQNDIKWLGYEWEDEAYFTSNYFDTLYGYAEKLIEQGDAYVDESTSEEMAEQKGTPTRPGIASPYRDRSVEENLRLFREMRDGKHEEGSMALRAKIDMASNNMLLRDPIIYRIKFAHHHNTGDKWCIYPMYDFAHGQSDSIEKITHSLCSLEFIHHRPLYDWFIEKLEIFPSRQIEFSRMNVEYMLTSKRKMLKLVNDNYVNDWDDPRMPTIAGMRRKGYPAAAIRAFCDKVGMTKRENVIEIDLLESCVRDELNSTAHRAMVVLDPIKLIITNYPEGQSEMLLAENNPEDEAAGKREMPFSRELLIEREDYMENAPKKYFRLSEGKNVRLKHAFIVHCTGSKKDEDGNVVEVYAEYYPDSKSGQDTSGIKSKGTLHWVDAQASVPCEIREINHLFTDPTPDSHEGKDFIEFYNEDSIVINNNARMEPSLAGAKVGQQFQFMRKGYYVVDQDSTEGKKVFNRTVSLKSSWKGVKKG